MVPTPTVSIGPPIILPDWAQPARRDASDACSSNATTIKPATIFGVVLGILAFGVLAYWIPKRLVPWYQAGRAKVAAEKRRMSDHEFWLKYVRSSSPPRLESIRSLDSTAGIQTAIDGVWIDPGESDLPFRNLAAQPNHAAVKATDFYIPEDHDQVQVSPIGVILEDPPTRLFRNGAPTLRVKPQTPPHYALRNHHPVARPNAYQKVGNVFRQSPFPLPGTVHPQFPTVGDYIHGRGEFSKPSKLQRPVKEYSRPISDVEHSSYESGPRESFQTSRTGVTDISTNPSIHDATSMVVLSARGRLTEVRRNNRVDGAVFVVGDDDDDDDDEEEEEEEEEEEGGKKYAICGLPLDSMQKVQNRQKVRD
ncbi:hypothetical protein K505DRAFT_365683 [Melanomma pulvis-pyrius CBS 109.77]|uniref:Uncharacterized protein n=1 Tax=Melanomma pulvis-pyrius CBS 109.77 TaxID=1314802 RepID=A0A6A6WZ40_9PLEO|nr:hypothetical protein K505DRAFT_365683 [Melanomma pulvis-pyrius CBS 109.77]